MMADKTRLLVALARYRNLWHRRRSRSIPSKLGDRASKEPWSSSRWWRRTGRSPTRWSPLGTDARWRGAGYNPRDSFHPSDSRWCTRPLCDRAAGCLPASAVAVTRAGPAALWRQLS